MNPSLLTWLVAGLALGVCLAAFGRRLQLFRSLAQPIDSSLPRGEPGAGVRYAFTTGMLPWAKESTRRHWAAYLRGIGFHIGIFVALALLLASPWLTQLPLAVRVGLSAAVGAAGLLGLAGLVARRVEPTLRHLSTADDYFAVALVSLFLASAAAAPVFPAWLPVFNLMGAAVLVYAPFGKIRHCVYYPYSRLFFGRYFGRRGVLPPRHALKVSR